MAGVSRLQLRAQLACCVLLLAGPALAQEPMYVKNLGPLAGLLGLPSQRDATTAAAGAFALATHASVANNYVSEVRSDERLNLDGETLRLALEARYGIAERWDLQLEVPWLDHSGGHLDSLIDNWHDLWGMPDGGRSDVDRDLLQYSYAGPGTDFLFDDDASGLGDISLALSYQWYGGDLAAASAVLGYKFGTGDEADFTGSGADDVFVALRFSGAHLADLPLRWHGQLGYLRAGNSDLMQEQQENDIWFAGLSMDWVLGPNWSLLGQLDAHGAPLDSGLTGVGDEAVLLAVGARWRLAGRWALDFQFVEDIAVETAPDITFQASIRYR
jgi:hypothetical protein